MTDPFLRAEHVQGSPEWLEHRRRHIGASDAPIIMGDSPWMTPYELWLDKMGLSEPRAMTAAMQRGVDLEPHARAVFEGLMGKSVFPQVVYHKHHTGLMASLDGLSLDGEIAVEIKCPGDKTHAVALNGEIPSHYYAQLQHQLACTGLVKMYYCSYSGDEKTAIVEVLRDDEYIDDMIDKEMAFYECVRTGVPPELCDRDYRERDDGSWVMDAVRLKSIDEELQFLEKEKAAIKSRLIQEADGRSCRGRGVTLTRTFPKGRINYSKIPELQEMDLERYRCEPKEVWTLRISR